MVARLSHFLSSWLHKPVTHQAKAESPVMVLAQVYAGQYAFLDELTNKTHSLVITPELTIKIDRKTLAGHVVGLTTSTLTFQDHYGYELVIQNGETGPVSIYDEAEAATYAIIQPESED